MELDALKSDSNMELADEDDDVDDDSPSGDDPNKSPSADKLAMLLEPLLLRMSFPYKATALRSPKKAADRASDKALSA